MRSVSDAILVHNSMFHQSLLWQTLVLSFSGLGKATSPTQTEPVTSPLGDVYLGKKQIGYTSGFVRVILAQGPC